MTGQPHNCRGFSLIEAAIVLAVVGLVIGGIWWAASAVRDTYRINKTIEGVNFIVISVQKSMTEYNASLIGGNHITGFVEATGGFPKDWGQPNGGFNATSPLGTNVAVYNHVNRFHIWMYDLKNTYCAKIITKISEIGYKNKAGQVGTKFIGVYPIDKSNAYWDSYSATGPISLTQAVSSCGSSNRLEIEYLYTRYR